MAGRRIIILIFVLGASAVILAAGAFVLEKKNFSAEKAISPDRPANEAVNESAHIFPYDRNLFNSAISKNYLERMATSGPVIAGLVPHHELAGDLAAEFFSSLAQKQKVNNFIVIGPLHSDQAVGPAVSGRFIWDAGFGQVENNYEILDDLVAAHLVVYDENAVRSEHALYNMAPFIAHYFPEAKIAPIALTSRNSPEQCFALAQALQKYLAQGDTVLVASIDFSHYLPADQTPAKNLRMIELIKNKDYQTIAGLANDYLDSPPSLITLLKAADLSDAGVNILASTNSGEITGTPVLSSTSYISAFFAVPLLSNESVPAKAGKGSGPVSVLPTASSSPLKLLFFGDIMLDRQVGEKIKASGSLDWIFKGLNSTGIFQGNDIVSANLEGAATDNGAHYPPALVFDFAFAPKLVGELAKYNFNYFNLANNHLADQGKNGIIETEKNLTDLGFVFAGCQDRQVGDCTAKIVEKSGRQIGLIGASMVYGALDENRLIAEVKKLASSTDLVAVQIHWGTEYKHEAAANQTVLARKLIDAGADIIIGHHPHVVGGVELYKNKPIFYSLGNFVFDQYFSLDTQEELGVRIAVTTPKPLLGKEGGEGKNFQIDLLPIKSEAGRLRLMNNAEKDKFLTKLAGWSIGDKNFLSEVGAGKIVIE
ncbi:MAG: AmmeMemoRadiSam system protein B [Patescibacteria group bacterium]|nr:AmmeMemoRadiSam system protein B [Patescibacteria group bacterium]